MASASAEAVETAAEATLMAAEVKVMVEEVVVRCSRADGISMQVRQQGLGRNRCNNQIRYDAEHRQLQQRKYEIWKRKRLHGAAEQMAAESKCDDGVLVRARATINLATMRSNVSDVSGSGRDGSGSENCGRRSKCDDGGSGGAAHQRRHQWQSSATAGS